MEAVRRYDRGELRKPEKDERTGYLRADGYITRVGVFPYRLANGKVRRELRLPEEVFHSDSMQSFDDAPLTNGHPVEHLDVKNTRRHQVGSIRDPRRDDSHMRARLLITDDETIEQAQSGRRQLSCGYTCELEMRAGVTDGIDGVDDGLKFDAIQRNIRGNHVAILDKGRAGSSVSIRLDANDAIMSVDDDDPKPSPKPEEPMNLVTKRIDGVDIEFSKQGAQAVEKFQAKCDQLTESADATKADLDKEKARADKAEEDLAQLKTDTKDKLSDDAIQKRVNDRVKLVTDARDVLGEKDDKGEEIKLDGLSDLEIKKRVIVAKSPKAELEEKSDAYIEARFDAAMEAHKSEKDDGDDDKKDRRRNPSNSMRNPRTDGNSSNSARQRMIDRNRNAWKGDQQRSDN